MSTPSISHTLARCLIQEKVPRGTSKSAIRIQILEYVANAEKQAAAVPAAIKALEEIAKVKDALEEVTHRRNSGGGQVRNHEIDALTDALEPALKLVRAALAALKGNQ